MKPSYAIGAAVFGLFAAFVLVVVLLIELPLQVNVIGGLDDPTAPKCDGLDSECRRLAVKQSVVQTGGSRGRPQVYCRRLPGAQRLPSRSQLHDLPELFSLDRADAVPAAYERATPTPLPAGTPTPVPTPTPTPVHTPGPNDRERHYHFFAYAQPETWQPPRAIILGGQTPGHTPLNQIDAFRLDAYTLEIGGIDSWSP